MEQGRRRSARVLLSVPIGVRGTGADGKKFEEEARTLVVNAHGALISLAAPVRGGSAITIEHMSTKQTLDCRVVWVGNQAGKNTQVGIEFSKPSPLFWQIDFPPEDWVIPES